MYQLDATCLHQVGTSSLLIYMMHGHTSYSDRLERQ